MAKHFLSSKQDLQKIICANHVNVYVKNTRDHKTSPEINSHTVFKKPQTPLSCLKERNAGAYSASLQSSRQPYTKFSSTLKSTFNLHVE